MGVDTMGKPTSTTGSGATKDNDGRILIVEDEEHIRELIALHLTREGLDFDVAASAEEAWSALKKSPYSLIVLDWMLPGASGIDIAKRLRRETDFGDIGILMVTARAEASDIVEGLEAGADDYLSKPFEAAVLIARVRALLRRNRRSGGPEVEGDLQVVRIGMLKLYPETFECKGPDGLIQLTPSEFKLMIALASSGGRVLTRDGLISQIQGEGVAVVGRTVDTHVFGLRKKLGDYADVIETVRGIGYRVKPS
jgi:two-component system phosphate regulon response regulator PhoB